eukprot:TRINITY_DN82758_c0_g1_i1.p1 TRINITY_DN82758_c0_g1~~TRINITY_DN82758_c0_g1_i1.p1  ORF type:complete len:192 (-),score=21.32 TRINITY_DN82758_c0_g1_i1:182-757(-)
MASPTSTPVRVVVGSGNPGKVEAAKIALARWKIDASVTGVSVPSGVADMPHDLEETLEGARNRAQAVLNAPGVEADLGVGLESGFLTVDKMGLVFDVCACCIVDKRDGRCMHGVSSGLSFPPSVAATYKEKGYNPAWEEALGSAPGSSDPNGDGVLGILTGGILTRPKQMAESFDQALLQYANAKLYTGST